jgi:hypothetical protein
MRGRVIFVCVTLAGCKSSGGSFLDGGRVPIDASGAIDGHDAVDGNPVPSPDATPPDAGCAPGPTASGFRLVACGTMAQPRWRHEAALLPDGRVLIAGGWRDGSTPGDVILVADVEVFDPATETFAVVGTLDDPRVAHRVTALADGRVLVTGGEVAGGAITSTTEIFDPATDTISAGPRMLLPRSLHTATLLADGRVLITGGETTVDPDPDSEGVAAAEVFDPATDAFIAVGTMTAERHAHEAVRLHDGRVLVTGGADAPSCCDDGIADAELFDPATDTFTASDPLVTARPRHRLTRLDDGRVLVTGGSIAHGGASGPTYLEAAELYDPASATFASTGAMTTAPGWSFTATRLASGDVLVAGGLLGSGAEVYDASAGTFSVLGDRMIESRTMHSATLLASGAVLLVGGPSLANAELYFP